jgi:uncharacterized delta-60 repeat protein
MSRLRTLAAALAVTSGVVFASDGMLDPTFAQGSGVFFPSYGYLSASVGDHDARGIVLDDDQRITVVGDFQRDASVANRDCGLLRALPDAQAYDASFLPPTGYRDFAFDRGGTGTDLCFGIALRDDQGVIVVGSVTVDAAERRSGLVFQTTADGSFDTQFYGDGTFETAADGPPELIASDVEFRHVLRDGSGVVVSGPALVPVLGGGSLSQAVALRFNADGSLDEQFTPEGPVAFLGGDAGGILELHGMARAADGSLWFAGDRSGSGAGDGGRLFRLLPDGTLDPDLGGGNGMRVPQCAFVTAIAIDPTGRLLLGCDPSDASHLAGLLRLIPAGNEREPDPAFGSAGFASIRVRADDAPGIGSQLGSPVAIALQPDGRIVIAGTYLHERLSRNPADAVVARLQDDGALDPSFAAAGIARFGFAGVLDLTRDTANALALDAAARPLMVGSSYSTKQMSRSYVVARLQHVPDDLFADGFEAP